MTRVRMPSVSLIVARSRNTHVIGCDNQLPWRLKSDLMRFKQLTTSHAVIMGRKTFESIGRRLPNRLNIVLSRQANPESLLSQSSEQTEQLCFVRTPENALLIADKYSIYHGAEDIFVIGGEEIYKVFHAYVNAVYLTEVYADVDGDAFFKVDFNNNKWRVTESHKRIQERSDEFMTDFFKFDKAKKALRYRDAFMEESVLTLSLKSRLIHTKRPNNAHEMEFKRYLQPRIEFS